MRSASNEKFQTSFTRVQLEQGANSKIIEGDFLYKYIYTSQHLKFEVDQTFQQNRPKTKMHSCLRRTLM